MQDTEQDWRSEHVICLRCYHVWWPRKNAKPVMCPKCRSPYWDRWRKGEG